MGQLQGVSDPLEELVDLAPIGEQDGKEPRFPFVHQIDISDMPASGNPAQVLDNNIRGRCKLGKRI
eukprot:6326462-Prorocentrum_lima.AAC.1